MSTKCEPGIIQSIIVPGGELANELVSAGARRRRHPGTHISSVVAFQVSRVGQWANPMLLGKCTEGSGVLVRKEGREVRWREKRTSSGDGGQTRE